MKIGLIKRIAVLVIGVLVISLYWHFGFRNGVDNGSGKVQASVPKIESSSDEEFVYEYEGSTFEVHVGEKNEKPRIKFEQGQRVLDFTVSKKPVVSVSDDEDVLGVSDIDVTEDENADVGQEFKDENLEEGEVEVEFVVEEEDVVEQESGDVGREQEKNLPEVEDEVSTEGNLLGPLSTWFGIQEAIAQEEIVLVDEESEPAVEFKDEQVVMTPNLDKVTMDFEVGAEVEPVVLTVNPENLMVSGTESEVIFQTRTNRKAFALKNAFITDESGEKGEVKLDIKGTNNLIGDGSSEMFFEITLLPDAEWIQGRDGEPSVIKIDLVSLFHDRMIPAFPTKKDFSSDENLKFDVGVVEIEDEDLKQSLASGNLEDVKFGLIDAMGNTRELKVQKFDLDNVGEILRLELTLNRPEVATGLFDLLVQKGDSTAYISEEDFSWGVLAINPDQSVYDLGSEATIDMAVLDKMGRMVCDARVELEIEDPLGNKIIMSTDNGLIEVSLGCVEYITELPDYTSSYATGVEGEYKMRLLAETDDGIFEVEDAFQVNGSSPYYLKRVGATRIFPLQEYSMNLSIDARENVDRVEELVPSNFTIKNISDGGKIDKKSGVDGALKIVWDVGAGAGETLELSYEYDAPDISPALFLLGPVEILGGVNWFEGRQWQVASDDTATTTFVFTSDAESWNYTDDSASCSGTHSTTGGNPGGELQMTGSKSGGAITCNAYWEWSGTWEDLGVTAGNDVTGISGNYDHEVTNDSSNGTWNTGAFELRDSGATLRETMVAALTGQTGTQTYTNRSGTEQTFTAEASTTSIRLRLNTVVAFGGGNRSWDSANDNIEVVVTHDVPSSDPTTDELMRHGNYFASEAEVKFFWVD